MLIAHITPSDIHCAFVSDKTGGLTAVASPPPERPRGGRPAGRGSLGAQPATSRGATVASRGVRLPPSLPTKQTSSSGTRLVFSNILNISVQLIISRVYFLNVIFFYYFNFPNGVRSLFYFKYFVF